MEELSKLFNVDGTENKSGQLKYYTDLQVQTGTNYTNLCFYLTELGEQKAIMGYLWFAAVQPKIDWKCGWIDHTQLPIILRANNAKSHLCPPTKKYPKDKRTRGILHWQSHFPPEENPCCTNWGNPSRIPMASKGLQRRKVTMITLSHHLGSCS